MRLLDGWRRQREDDWIARWKAEHRWDALARYNAEKARGLVHTPEWQELMRHEQEAFNKEHYGDLPTVGHGFPILLEPHK